MSPKRTINGITKLNEPYIQLDCNSVGNGILNALIPSCFATLLPTQTIQDRIMYHSGRLDANGGHHNYKTTPTSYHFHRSTIKQTFIVNPYTGKKILLGQPYVFQNESYYSLNLVSKALTAHDSMGVELSLNNTGGIFNACSTGDSTMNQLGNLLIFTYPKILFLTHDNTFFETSNEELQLLCHTKKAEADNIQCYAYISLKTIGTYMAKDSYFADLCDDGTGVWRFIRNKDVLNYPQDDLEIFTPINIDITGILESMPVTWVVGKLIEELENKGIIDIESLLNQSINTLFNELGLFDLTPTDIENFLMGAIISVDDNLFLSAAQSVVGWLDFGFIPPDDNHYYMLGKMLTDSMFLAAFLKMAGTAAIDAAKALSEAAGLAAVGLVTAETGIGFAVFETGAGVKLLEAAGAACIATVAGAGAAHSGDVLSKDAAKYIKTPQPKLAPSEILKNNIIKEKIMKFPPYKFACHHIVAWKCPYAQGARDILMRLGIDVNAGCNGVFLPFKDGQVALKHASLHTREYYENIEFLLSKATSSEDATRILAEIRAKLLDGTFPIKSLLK